jgi:hypothetical protein
MERVTLEESLECVGGYSKTERFADIRRHLDSGWIERGVGGDGNGDAEETTASG